MAKKPASGEGGQNDPAVAAFLEALDHPLKKQIVVARKIILGVDPAIVEGVKWNAPSFRTTDYFATMHLRATDQLQMVFHRGAKARAAKAMAIPDPGGLMKWLAPDRCLVSLGKGRVFTANRPALAAIVRAWVDQL
jgi:hypothetical protein